MRYTIPSKGCRAAGHQICISLKNFFVNKLRNYIRGKKCTMIFILPSIGHCSQIHRFSACKKHYCSENIIWPFVGECRQNCWVCSCILWQSWIIFPHVNLDSYFKLKRNASISSSLHSGISVITHRWLSIFLSQSCTHYLGCYAMIIALSKGVRWFRLIYSWGPSKKAFMCMWKC